MKDTQKASSKFWVRMMAWILCILMVLSLAITSIVFIVDAIRGEEETTQDSGDNHDHDGDGKADH